MHFGQSSVNRILTKAAAVHQVDQTLKHVCWQRGDVVHATIMPTPVIGDPKTKPKLHTSVGQPYEAFYALGSHVGHCANLSVARIANQVLCHIVIRQLRSGQTVNEVGD